MTRNPTAGGRVVLVSGRDPLLTVGGFESYVEAHALAARVAGYEPHVFCAAARSERLHTDFGELHRVASPLRPIRSLTAELHRLPMTRAITGYLRQAPGPHIVHGFGAWAVIAVAAAHTLARQGISAVPVATAFTTHRHEAGAKLAGVQAGHGTRQRLLHALEYLWACTAASSAERRGYRGARLVLVNYESVRRLLHEAYGDALNIRRITYAPVSGLRDGPPPAATPDALRGLEPSDGPLIVTVSRHDPRKGLDVLLHALARLAATGVPFRACLVGPGVLLDAHRRLAEHLGLSGRVSIAGRVADVRQYLHAADVFVLPSLEEGSGSVSVLEALQAGLAIVASDVDGIPEDLADAADALLVAPGDPRALESALRRLVTDLALRERLASRSLRLYCERFSGAAYATDIAGVYREVIARER